MKTVLVALALALFAPQEAKVTAVNPDAIKWVEAAGAAPGMATSLQWGDAEKGPCQYLVKFPAGSVAPPHYHKFDEFATVVSGTMAFGEGDATDESKLVEVSAGGYVLVPAGTAHWAKCSKDAVITRFSPGPRDFVAIKDGVKAPGSGKIQITQAKDAKWEQAPGMAEGIKTVLQFGDPKVGPYIILLKFPAGTYNPPHFHTADEAVTILEGTMITGEGQKADDAKGLAVSAGGYFIIPGKTPHWGKVPKGDVVLTRLGNGPRDITYFDKK